MFWGSGWFRFRPLGQQSEMSSMEKKRLVYFHARGKDGYTQRTWRRSIYSATVIFIIKVACGQAGHLSKQYLLEFEWQKIIGKIPFNV